MAATCWRRHAASWLTRRGACNLRVSSYLAYDDYYLDDLPEPIEDLLALAEKFDMKVHVENEACATSRDSPNSRR